MEVEFEFTKYEALNGKTITTKLLPLPNSAPDATDAMLVILFQYRKQNW